MLSIKRVMSVAEMLDKMGRGKFILLDLTRRHTHTFVKVALTPLYTG